MKYKAIFKKNNGDSEIVVGTFDKRKEAVNKLLDTAQRNVDYCLDSREIRHDALMERDWYVCGCGPAELIIEEVE